MEFMFEKLDAYQRGLGFANEMLSGLLRANN